MFRAVTLFLLAAQLMIWGVASHAILPSCEEAEVPSGCCAGGAEPVGKGDCGGGCADCFCCLEGNEVPEHEPFLHELELPKGPVLVLALPVQVDRLKADDAPVLSRALSTRSGPASTGPPRALYSCWLL